MDIAFSESRPSTIGIEWELPLVDHTSGDLVSRAPDVLRAVRAKRGSDGRVTEELLTNTVEVVSGVHGRISAAARELSEVVRDVIDAAATVNADVMCAGTHPFAVWDRAEVTPDSERYATLMDRTRWWGRQMLIWGVHVHVGIDNREKTLPILSAMLHTMPHVQALTASSPYWGGTDTGYASNRAMMLQQLPTGGIPPQLGAWANFEELVADLTRTGVIEDHSELRWDLRPSPRWGTLENRVSDGISTLGELASIAALIQCLVTDASETLDRGGALPTLQPWYVRENKWRAARYGMKAEIIVNAAGDERPVIDDMRDQIDHLTPVAERLGCATELQALAQVPARGASYQRQLQVAADAGGDLRAVVAHLVTELRESLD